MMSTLLLEPTVTKLLIPNPYPQDEPQRLARIYDTVNVRSVSVVAPAYREEVSIASTVSEWVRYFRASDRFDPVEIIVCNDGSPDRTGSILDELAAREPIVHPVHLPQNQGAAAALAIAISRSSNDWVLLIDSDGQFAIGNIATLADAIERDGTRAAMGVRRKKDSRFARFGTWSSGLVCNAIYGTSYRDFNSALKLVDGKLLRSLTLEAKGLNYSTEVTAKLLERGVRISQVEIEHLPRQGGKSSMKLLRDAAHRLMFVAYLGLRRILLRARVLRLPE